MSTLEDLPTGGTRISFEYQWIVAPLVDRLTAPLVCTFIRRNNATSKRRPAARLVELR